jgi:hypothetical protein
MRQITSQPARNSLLRIIFIGLTVLLIGSLGWFLVVPTFAKMIHQAVVGRIISVSGASEYLVNGLVLLVMLPLIWALATILKPRLLSRFISTIRGRPVQSLGGVARVVVLLYIVAHFLSMWALSRETLFETSGEVVKCYTIDEVGRLELFDIGTKVNPRTGAECIAVTPVIAASVNRYREGRVARPLQASENVSYFDTTTGTPLVYYYRLPDGGIQRFAGPGFHPDYREPLLAVTPDVVREFDAQIRRTKEAERVRAEEAERQARAEKAKAAEIQQALSEQAAKEEREAAAVRLAQRYADLSQKVSAAVLVLENGQFSRDLSESVAAARNSLVAPVRQPAFEEGVVRSALSGSSEAARKLGAGVSISRLLLVDVKVEVRTSQIAGEQVSRVTAEATCLEFSGGMPHSRRRISSVGVGFSAEVARAQALAEFVKQLSEASR